jgi:hypothetical protein
VFVTSCPSVERAWIIIEVALPRAIYEQIGCKILPEQN